MKKVRIALSASLAIALVAGVFAFTPAKFNNLCTYKLDDKGTPSTSDDICVFDSKDTYVIDNVSPALTIVGATRTENPDQTCPAAPAVSQCRNTINLDFQ